jgi:hypothetical protein
MASEAKPVYTRLRDMPQELREVARAHIHTVATGAAPGRSSYDTVAAEVNTVLSGKDYTVDLSRDIIRDVLKRKRVQGQPFEVKDRPPSREEQEQQRREELRSMILEGADSLRPVPDHIKATQIEDMGFDTPESMVALFSDLHYGSRIDRKASGGIGEYNIDLARERLCRWRDGLLRFAQMRQIFMKVPRFYGLALGDDFEGHGLMFPSQGIQMEVSVERQVAGFAVDMTQIILDLTQRFEHSVWLKVRGNHGRITARDRESYGPDNVELWAWQLIAEAVSKQTGGAWIEYGEGADKYTSPTGTMSLVGGMVDFHIARPFFLMTEIEGWLFYLRHGHKIGGLRRTYTGAFDNKLHENAVIGEVINFMCKGHLHTAESAEDEIGGEVIQNGCFVGPSPQVLEGSRPTANLPSQDIMFMHPKRRKTQQTRIHLATVDEVRAIEVIGRVPKV